MALITPTVFAVELTTLEIIVGLIVAILGSSVISALITVFAGRRKAGADAHKTETETMTDLSEKFIDLVKDFAKAKRESISAEERHSLERIASSGELSDLRERVENCDREHIEWAECKNAMLSFLVTIEPELQAITSQPTLLAAVTDLKGQIEET